MNVGKENVDTVRVIARFRPMNDLEKEMGAQSDLKITKEQVKIEDKNFNFDNVLSFKSTQKQVYKIVAVPVLNNVFQGWNGTIIAYG